MKGLGQGVKEFKDASKGPKETDSSEKNKSTKVFMKAPSA